jgi:cytochrome P450
MTTPTPAAPRAIPFIKGAPIIGNLLTFGRDSIGTIDRVWKEHGDIYRIQLAGNRSFTIVSSPDLAHEALVDRKAILRRPADIEGGTLLTPMLGLSVLTTDGETWFTRRRMMQPIFHRQRIQAMGETMAAGGARMLARWEKLPDGAEVMLNEEMKLVTLDIINGTMFSSDVLPEVDRIGHSVDVGLHYTQSIVRNPIRLPASWPTPGNRRFWAAKALLDDYLYRMIRERRASAEKKGDLLDMLLEAHDEDTGKGMTDQEVRNEVATIYGAGHETTALALTWTWYALSQNPEALRRLQAEVDTVLKGRAPTFADLPSLPFTLATLEESMRLFPPVPFTARMAYAPLTLGEYALPQGAFVGIAINNIHRHPDFWDEPEAFKPERFLPENRAKVNRNAYIPFLTGPHVCIGNTFALMEGQLLLAMLAQRYEMALVPGQRIVKEQTITMRPRYGIRMVLKRRGI